MKLKARESFQYQACLRKAGVLGLFFLFFPLPLGVVLVLSFQSIALGQSIGVVLSYHSIDRRVDIFG